jgi:germination protein M
VIERVTKAMIALLLVATACGSEDLRTRSVDGAPRKNGKEPAPAQESTFAYEVWFQKGNFLYVVTRDAPETPRVAQTAIESLLEGPSAAEGPGLTTAIPPETQLLGIVVEEGIATVDLSSSFDDGGGSAAMLTRLAQVVFTLTQFPTVDAVEFQIGGEPVDVFSAEGIVIERPQTRADFEELAPPIVVTSPTRGDQVSSPVTIEGTANVFEATVSIRILDSGGNELAATFATATCGTGCRGDFSKEVDFDVSGTENGAIKVFEQSAEDGSPLHVVNVPVVLLP